MIPLLLALACIVANGFFVAAEFAFAKVRATSLEALARAGDPRAARALRMTRRLDAYLPATQLGITVASLALGWLGEPAIARIIGPPLGLLSLSDGVVHGVATAVAFGSITLLHIVIGELVPKSVALRRPEAICRWSGGPLRAFFLITWPMMWLLNQLSMLVLRASHLPTAPRRSGGLSAEEIRIIIHASFESEDEQDRKRDLLERVLRGTDRSIRAIMVPRVDMVSIDLDADAARCIKLTRKHGHSRYPLCEDGDPDRVRGYVHVKDLLIGDAESPIRLRSIKRDVLFVPESAKVGDVLSRIQLTAIPIAIVVDEYGGTDGLVTIEDVVEEIVGDIQDEHDAERPRIVTQEDGTVVAEGSVPMDELQLEGLALPSGSEAESIAAYVVGHLGRLARPGDRVRSGTWDVVVQDVRRRRVARAALVRRTPSERPDAGAAPSSVHDAGPDARKGS